MEHHTISVQFRVKHFGCIIYLPLILLWTLITNKIKSLIHRYVVRAQDAMTNGKLTLLTCLFLTCVYPYTCKAWISVEIDVPVTIQGTTDIASTMVNAHWLSLTHIQVKDIIREPTFLLERMNRWCGWPRNTEQENQR